MKEDRDLAEYIYKVETLTNLKNHEFKKIRRELHKFFHDYGDRCTIEKITPKHFDEILNVQKEWFSQKTSVNHDPDYIKALSIENEYINNVMFENFEALGLCGIVLFIDKKVKGYYVGGPLSEKCFDGISIKTDGNIPYLSKVLMNEFVKICCKGYEYLNMEEDLGFEGLRNFKLILKPEFLINKFILTETEAK